MEGFYTKPEAATILGVSLRQVQLYLKAGRLRRVFDAHKSTRRSYIPQEDVERLYDERKTGAPSARAVQDETRALSERVRQLEGTVEILKFGLGFGAEKKPRTEAELLLLRQQALDYLAKPTWTSPQISAFIDELATLREEDVYLLRRLRGVTALVPLFDLQKRMMAHVEREPLFPGNGLDALHGRMIRARDRLLGLLHAASLTKSDIPSDDAAKIHKLLDVKAGGVDLFVANYIAGLSGSEIENSQGFPA